LGSLTLKIDVYRMRENIASYGNDLLPHTPKGIIWFNFPWNGQKTTHQLLIQFVSKAAGLQCEGGIVLIGTTKNSRYIGNYGWDALFQHAKLMGYNVHYEDRFFIAKDCALDFGYHHVAVTGNDVHYYMVHRAPGDPWTDSPGSTLHIFVKGLCITLPIYCTLQLMSWD
jgi:hypothetical protein